MQIAGSVLNNYDSVLQRVKEACLRSGRNFNEVNILAVTKYALEEDIITLLTNRNVYAAAESRLQDSLKKWENPALASCKVKKFFIGHLQSNKTLKVLENFDVICSLDSFKLASRINEQCAKLGKKAQCLAQIKLTDKDTQGGVTLTEARGLIKDIRAACENINLKGIMAIAPVADNPQDLRPLFKEVRNFFDDNFTRNDYLSLGMTEDFEIAVEEGSTLPRIGSAIFSRTEGGRNDN